MCFGKRWQWQQRVARLRPPRNLHTARRRNDTSMEKKESKTEKPTALLVAGFAAGTVVTGLLNPVDRALFLSVSLTAVHSSMRKTGGSRSRASARAS